MNSEEYKVEGNKTAANKLAFMFLFISAWPFILYILHPVIVDCSLEFDTCSIEQIYTNLYFQTLAPLPFAILLAYIGYYSLKVLLQKQIPPKGNSFPYTINRVIYRDHYTFGITGVTVASLSIYAVINHVYSIISITNI